MVLTKMMRGNETAIVDSGKSYMFGLDGKCYKEDAGNLVSCMEGALELPIVSVLTSGGFAEVGVFLPGQDMARYASDLQGAELAMTLQMAGGFIKMLRRSGKQAGVAFNQLIFVYREGFDIYSLLSKLALRRV